MMVSGPDMGIVAKAVLPQPCLKFDKSTAAGLAKLTDQSGRRGPVPSLSSRRAMTPASPLLRMQQRRFGPRPKWCRRWFGCKSKSTAQQNTQWRNGDFGIRFDYWSVIGDLSSRRILPGDQFKDRFSDDGHVIKARLDVVIRKRASPAGMDCYERELCQVASLHLGNAEYARHVGTRMLSSDGAEWLVPEMA